jgi:urea carboxylase/allophanate hydrolase
MCIYSTDSPGGYQLVGRTVDIWDSKAVPAESSIQRGQVTGEYGGKPWMFRVFDRITFYTVTEDELDSRPISELVPITDGELDLNEYETWIQQNADEIAAVAEQGSASIARDPFLKDPDTAIPASWKKL